MSMSFDVAWTEELGVELGRILRAYRAAALPCTNLAESIREAARREAGLLNEALRGIREALDRTRPPVIDLDVVEAVSCLRSSVQLFR